MLKQIEETDMGILEACKHREELTKKGVITPLASMQLDEIEANRAGFTAVGMEAHSSGTGWSRAFGGWEWVPVLARMTLRECTMWESPGSCHIFECLINNLMEVVQESGTWIHLFVMTSEKNHQATVSFLKEHEYFGYQEEYVHFFKQDMAAATDYQGKIYQ